MTGFFSNKFICFSCSVVAPSCLCRGIHGRLGEGFSARLFLRSWGSIFNVEIEVIGSWQPRTGGNGGIFHMRKGEYGVFHMAGVKLGWLHMVYIKRAWRVSVRVCLRSTRFDFSVRRPVGDGTMYGARHAPLFLVFKPYWKVVTNSFEVTGLGLHTSWMGWFVLMRLQVWVYIHLDVVLMRLQVWVYIYRQWIHLISF